MQKAYLILCSALLFTLMSCSKESQEPIPESDPEIPETRVSIKEAISTVENLLDFLDADRTRSGLPKRTVSEHYLLGETAATRSADAGDDAGGMFYLLNFANDEGFAIVGADRRLPTDIFAIADSGNIDPEEGIDNPGLALFLAALGELGGPDTGLGGGDGGGIKDFQPELPIVNDQGKPDPVIEYEYSDWEYYIYPGLRSGVTWKQGYPYNVYFPYVNDKQAVAGCVPVAVAQLMACWEYPASISIYPLNWTSAKSKEYDTDITTPSLSAARIIFELSGPQYLKATYGNAKDDAGTGVSSGNINPTLQKLGYSQPGTLSEYKSSVVESELKSGYPLMASGLARKIKRKFLGITIKTYYAEGHYWLIDELLQRKRIKYTYFNGQLSKTENVTGNLVYCNWGWGPDYNGYYYHETFDVFGGQVTTRSYVKDYYQYKVEMYTGVRK